MIMNSLNPECHCLGFFFSLLISAATTHFCQQWVIVLILAWLNVTVYWVDLDHSHLKHFGGFFRSKTKIVFELFSRFLTLHCDFSFLLTFSVLFFCFELVTYKNHCKTFPPFHYLQLVKESFLGDVFLYFVSHPPSFIVVCFNSFTPFQLL